MIRAMRHRGPDGYGFLVASGVGLAHARLSIIDLATGDQPIHNEDESVWVVFNGEIFNYRELRADLEANGHRFYTESDTEVIVHAYEEYGLDFLTHLNGQFAIALWDRNNQRLVLARDRVGIRPLFYAKAGRQLLFASEAKGLFASGLIDPILDRHGIAETCNFWAPLAPTTAFERVLALPPGHLLVFEGSQARLRRYWDWEFPPNATHNTGSYEECCEQLQELFLSAVQLQLRADVEIGSYLSGGLDSSAVSSAAAGAYPHLLSTFSLTFSDAEFDERQYQEELARRLGGPHFAVDVSPAMVGASFPKAVWHIEAPVVRTAPVPLMLLAERVREAGLKVVLTGEGADEIFAGYDLFKEAKIRRRWARAPSSRLWPSILARLYGYIAQSPTGQGALTSGYFGRSLDTAESQFFAHSIRWDSTWRTSRFFSKEMSADLVSWDARSMLAETLPPGFPKWAPLARDQYVEAHTLLSGYLLSAQGDRMAMASSIECRYPFLDHRLIEFANSLPARYKLRALSEKRILKKAVEPMLPRSIVGRTKQPYRAPDGVSFFQNGQPLEYVSDLLMPSSLRDAGHFDPHAVGRLLKKFEAGNAKSFPDNMAMVAIVSTMLLHEQFIKKRQV